MFLSNVKIDCGQFYKEKKLKIKCCTVPYIQREPTEINLYKILLEPYPKNQNKQNRKQKDIIQNLTLSSSSVNRPFTGDPPFSICILALHLNLEHSITFDTAIKYIHRPATKFSHLNRFDLFASLCVCVCFI